MKIIAFGALFFTFVDKYFAMCEELKTREIERVILNLKDGKPHGNVATETGRREGAQREGNSLCFFLPLRLGGEINYDEKMAAMNLKSDDLMIKGITH